MIPVLKPTYTQEIKDELCKVLDSGWTGNGPKVIQFEKEFANFTGFKYAVATNSATSALDLCLKVYGVRGGELITTPMTFISDYSVGIWNDMDVTFADINPRTLCIDPEAIHLNSETKAIIAVDSHGRLADVKRIRERIKEKNWPDSKNADKILIIEDAAHAMYTPGVGRYADITVFSFQAVKTLPIFDGGMLVTNDEEIAKKLKTLTWLGIEKSTYDRVGKKGYAWDYDITHDGIKAYMTDVQAVIGLGQLKRLEVMNARRREIQYKYNEAFKDIPEFTKPEYSHTVQYYTPEWINRDGLCGYLAEQGIATSVHFKPLSELTWCKPGIKRPLPNTEVWRKLLSLPCHTALTEEELIYIIEKVKLFYNQ